MQDLKPVVGDNVEFEELGNREAIINKILDRKNYLKRPKVSNISKVIFVIAPKMPSPNMLILDKELCYAEFLNIKPTIVINKTDLDEEEANRIFEIYTKSGYEVIKAKAEDDIGISKIEKVLKNNMTVLAGQSGVRKVYNNK